MTEILDELAALKAAVGDVAVRLGGIEGTLRDVAGHVLAVHEAQRHDHEAVEALRARVAALRASSVGLYVHDG